MLNKSTQLFKKQEFLIGFSEIWFSLCPSSSQQNSGRFSFDLKLKMNLQSYCQEYNLLTRIICCNVYSSATFQRVAGLVTSYLLPF